MGYFGFGGPVALVGYMHRDLVENRKWISEGEYREGLALAQLAPGPLAAQLGIYLGNVHYGILGASLCGMAFIVPSFIMVVLLGIAYKIYGILLCFLPMQVPLSLEADLPLFPFFMVAWWLTISGSLNINLLMQLQLP